MTLVPAGSCDGSGAANLALGWIPRRGVWDEVPAPPPPHRRYFAHSPRRLIDISGGRCHEHRNAADSGRQEDSVRVRKVKTTAGGWRGKLPVVVVRPQRRTGHVLVAGIVHPADARHRRLRSLPRSSRQRCARPGPICSGPASLAVALRSTSPCESSLPRSVAWADSRREPRRPV
jgi:hypothetical protein